MNIDKLSFYNSNYCIKCLSKDFSKTYYTKEQYHTETLIIPRQDGFICKCANCSFEWLSPINKKAYYTFDAAEQLECITSFLDKEKIPRTDKEGRTYSIIGRIEYYARSYNSKMYGEVYEEY